MMKSHPHPDRSSTRMSESQKEDLIRQYIPLVRKVIKQISKKLNDQESRIELFENGVLGLVRALETYSYEDQIPFPDYAEGYIRTFILEGHKKNMSSPVEIVHFTQIEELSIASEENEEIYSPPSGKAHDILDFETSDPLTCMLIDESSRLVDIAISRIPSLERQVIQMTFYENLSPAQIGRKLSISQKEVSELRTAALRRLRKHVLMHN